MSTPTSSKSLCLPLTRKHFCVSEIRGCTMGLFPKKRSLNGFMPALLNINVGSSLITIGAEGTISCPLEAKNFRKCSRINLDSMGLQGFVYREFRTSSPQKSAKQALEPLWATNISCTFAYRWQSAFIKFDTMSRRCAWKKFRLHRATTSCSSFEK